MASSPGIRSVTASMLNGPRYLASAWPWRALMACLLGAIFSVAGVLGLVPVLVLGVNRALRTEMWTPLLDIEAARLSLIDGNVAAGFRREVAAARDDRRLPSLRQVGYVLVITLLTGPVGGALAGFLILLDGVLLAAPWIADRADPINVGPWTVETPAQAWIAFVVGIVAVVISAYVIGAYSGAAGQLAAATVTDAPALSREVTRLADSRSALLAAVDQERGRIESELHDRVQHRLVALAVTLGMVENLHGDDTAGRVAADAHGQLDDILAELRSVIMGIQPRALSEYGLVAPVTDLVASFPIPVVCEFGDTERQARLPAAVEQVAYRVINETLTNAVKHAGAHG